MSEHEGRGVSVEDLERCDGDEPSEEELLRERLRLAVIQWCEDWHKGG